MRISLNSYAPVDEGLHAFRIIGMAFVGSHLNTYNGKMQNLMFVEIEFPTELRDDDEPHKLWKRMTASLNSKSAFRPFAETVMNRKLTLDELKSFDPRVLLDSGAMADVEHYTKDDGIVRAKIAGVTRPPKGMEIPPAITKGRILYDVTEHDDVAFEALPKFLQELVMASPEYRKGSAPPTPVAPNGNGAAKPKTLSEFAAQAKPSVSDDLDDHVPF
jgi:hypothetical protein